MLIARNKIHPGDIATFNNSNRKKNKERNSVLV